MAVQACTFGEQDGSLVLAHALAARSTTCARIINHEMRLSIRKHNTLRAIACGCTNFVFTHVLSRLLKLYLNHNNIGDAGLQSFAYAIGRRAPLSLKELVLNQNKIGDAGMQSFAAAAGNGALPALKELHLSGNRIGDGGLSAFVGVVSKGAIPQLTSLALPFNDVGHAGMRALAAACGSGALPALLKIFVDEELVEHPQLVAVCEPRGIEIA